MKKKKNYWRWLISCVPPLLSHWLLTTCVWVWVTIQLCRVGQKKWNQTCLNYFSFLGDNNFTFQNSFTCNPTPQFYPPSVHFKLLNTCVFIPAILNLCCYLPSASSHYFNINLLPLIFTSSAFVASANCSWIEGLGLRWEAEGEWDWKYFSASSCFLKNVLDLKRSRREESFTGLSGRRETRGYTGAKMKGRQIFRNFLDSLQRKCSEGKRREARDGLRSRMGNGTLGRCQRKVTHSEQTRSKSRHMTKNLSEKLSRFPHTRPPGKPYSQTQYRTTFSPN